MIPQHQQELVALDADELRFETLVACIRHYAARQPEKEACTFLPHGLGGDSHVLTYAELDRRARALAARLQTVTRPGDRAMVMSEQSLEYVVSFFGCLYAGVQAVPAFPPRPNRTAHRLEAMLGDAQPGVVLTTSNLLDSIGKWALDHADLPVQTIAVDQVGTEEAENWREPAISGDTIAYLQYTSGSTSVPKGVQVTHRNLIHNCSLMERGYALDADTVAVSWLPLFHDMGLIGMLLTPLVLGARVVLMAPFTFVQHPYRWLDAFGRYGGTFAAAPNFAYDFCVRRIQPQKRAGLDLSSWRVAINGSEPVRHRTLERFIDAFAVCGFRPEAFYPSYGLAEATLKVSGRRPSRADRYRVLCVDRKALGEGRVEVVDSASEGAMHVVGCGVWLPDYDVAIVHPKEHTRCGEGVVGEIWVKGLSVAQGYRNRPEETRETFEARLADSGEGPYLRTGDLGFVWDGELYIAGRIKDVIIIDGTNHYPQDIEITVERHPAVRRDGAAAFSVEVDDQEKLVVAVELDAAYLREHPETEWKAVQKAIRAEIARNHDLDTYEIVQVNGKLPRTSSGKLQRHVCKAAYLEGALGNTHA